ncbi:MAG: serine hydrolase, partial [Spirosomaceae bacterium]|nr:serine hydrolase [Spirosomataceae bacterium]
MKIASIIFLLIGLIALGVFAFIKFKAGNVEDKKNLESVIDKQCNKFIADGNSYGLVIGVIKNNKTYLKGYGTVKKGANILPDSSTIFELASTSKLFTTSTLQLLADNGKLKLDDKIQAILAEKVKLP